MADAPLVKAKKENKSSSRLPPATLPPHPRSSRRQEESSESSFSDDSSSIVEISAHSTPSVCKKTGPVSQSVIKGTFQETKIDLDDQDEEDSDTASSGEQDQSKENRKNEKEKVTSTQSAANKQVVNLKDKIPKAWAETPPDSPDRSETPFDEGFFSPTVREAVQKLELQSSLSSLGLSKHSAKSAKGSGTSPPESPFNDDATVHALDKEEEEAGDDDEEDEDDEVEFAEETAGEERAGNNSDDEEEEDEEEEDEGYDEGENDEDYHDADAADDGDNEDEEAEDEEEGDGEEEEGGEEGEGEGDDDEEEEEEEGEEDEEDEEEEEEEERGGRAPPLQLQAIPEADFETDFFEERAAEQFNVTGSTDTPQMNNLSQAGLEEDAGRKRGLFGRFQRANSKDLIDPDSQSTDAPHRSSDDPGDAAPSGFFGRFRRSKKNASDEGQPEAPNPNSLEPFGGKSLFDVGETSNPRDHSDHFETSGGPMPVLGSSSGPNRGGDVEEGFFPAKSRLSEDTDPMGSPNRRGGGGAGLVGAAAVSPWSFRHVYTLATLLALLIAGAGMATSYYGTKLALDNYRGGATDPLPAPTPKITFPPTASPVSGPTGGGSGNVTSIECSSMEAPLEFSLIFDAKPTEVGFNLKDGSAFATPFWLFGPGSFGSFAQFKRPNQFGICLPNVQVYKFEVTDTLGNGLASTFAGLATYGSWELRYDSNVVATYQGDCSATGSVGDSSSGSNNVTSTNDTAVTTMAPMFAMPGETLSFCGDYCSCTFTLLTNGTLGECLTNCTSS